MDKPYIETGFMDKIDNGCFSAYVYLRHGYMYKFFEFETKQELFDFCEGFMMERDKC